MTQRRRKGDPGETLRDDHVEVQLLAHLMQHPKTAPAYDAARCETRLFAHPIRRQVWNLVSECLEETIPPTWMSLQALATERQMTDVTPLYLMTFDRDPLPRLESAAIAQLVDRLRVLADARDEYAALQRDVTDLLAEPDQLGAIRARAQDRATGLDLTDSGFVTADVLHDREVVPLVDGVFEPDSLAFVWGPINVGKTFIVTDLAVGAASGGQFFGRRCQQAPVAMLAYEGTHKLRRRLDAAAAVRGLGSVAGLPIYVNVRPPGLADTSGITRVARYLERIGVRTVIVDTFHAACRGVLDIDSGAGGDAGRALEALRRLRPPGGVVVAVHHPGLTVRDRMRGAGAILAAADTEIEVAEGVIRSRKQRDLPSTFRSGFRLDPHAGTLVVTQTDVPLLAEREPDVASAPPLWQQIKASVRTGPMTLLELAEELSPAKLDSIDRIVRRHSTLFAKVDGTDGVARVSLVNGGTV